MNKIQFSPLPYYIVDRHFNIMMNSNSTTTYFVKVDNFLELVDLDSLDKIKHLVNTTSIQSEIVMKTYQSSYTLMRIFMHIEHDHIHIQLIQQDTVIEELSKQVIAHRQRLMNTDIELLESKEKLADSLHKIQELSSPVIKISNELAFIPLFGELTVELLRNNTDSILKQVYSSGAKNIFIDFTAVGIIEENSSNHFMSLVKSLDTMGLRVLLIGIKPHHAKQIYQQTGTLNVHTLHNLEKALSLFYDN